jgi:predicted DNA-binding WGR domain protein
VKICANLRIKSGNCFNHRFTLLRLGYAGQAQMNTDSKSADHVNCRASLRSYARQAEANSKAERLFATKGRKKHKN